MGKIISRRNFLKTAPALGAGLALGGKALAAGSYSEEPRINPDYKLSVLDIGYEGPFVSDYSHRTRALRDMLTHKLTEIGVPLVEPGAVLAELELRGVDFERFLEYPGYISQLDPKSNLIKNTDVIVGMCTDYERIPSTITPNYGRQNLPDQISVQIVDLVSGDILVSLREEGSFEHGAMDGMMDLLVGNIAKEYRRIRNGY